MKQRLVALIVGFVVAAGWVPSVGAYQDQAIRWQLVEFSRAGEFSPGLTPGGDARVLIGLHSLEEFGNSSLLLVFKCAEDPVSANRPISNLENVLRYGVKPRNQPWEDPGPRWRVCPEQSAILLEGEGSNFSLLVDFLREVSEGLSPRIPVDVFVLSEDELARIDRQKDIGCQWADIVGKRDPSAQVVIDLYYRLDAAKHTWISGHYHDIFGAPERDPLLGRPTGDYLKDAAFLPVDILSFQAVRPIPAETQDDGGKRFEETLRKVLAEKSALVGTEFCAKEDFKVSLSDGPGSAAAGVLSASPALGIGTYNLSGRFSTKWTADHSLHPGFGFRMEAWTDDFLGIWVKLGEEWIQSDGRWSLTIPATPIFQGKRLRIFYRTRTDYYDVQSLAGNHYRWVDPDWLNIPFTFSTGHRYADTDGGVYNGVGELVDAAMYMWSRLYWNGGINPVRGSPINIFAPNTTYDCGDGSGVPWSCASTDGNIWLIASHATAARVVSHELGHQLNYKFWANKRPANPGGSHSSGSCYPTRTGMTLLEGFATFVSGWVGYPGRNVAVGGFDSGRWALSRDIEDRNAPPDCTNGWENEGWVTRAFWDLHDTHTDGLDVLWFNNLGATPVLYLANGVANDGDARDMRFYETIYRNAASPGHQTHISNIFDQNRH